MEIDYQKWIAYWKESNLFTFKQGDTDKSLFVIDTPPPFTSGDLHMGQVYWVVYTDSLSRYYTLKGCNVLYPVGWDMQGFPTELLVEKQYGRKIPREEFYTKCTEIANANKDSMKKQMLSLGAMFDGVHEYMTMSEDYRRKVQLSLLIMNDKGFIYRAKHPVAWCSKCNTSIAREEIDDNEQDAQFNYIDFKVGERELEIATTRPELLHACVAVAVNPGDKRHAALVGKRASVPLSDREVPIIADEMIDKEFGTGAEMVCTFGDKNDVIMFYKHKLEHIEAMDGRGNIINSGKYDGLNAKDARAMVLKELSEKGLLKRQESIKHTVKTHDRCHTEIELLSSMQWFMHIKEHAEKIKEIAHDVEFIPDFKRQNLYDWANFIEWDWNISRNRIFGTPLPFWYCGDCGAIIPAERERLPVNPAFDAPPAVKCPKCGSIKIVGEHDTCDVWVDSSITPLVVAGWPDNKELFNRAFPATLRIQGPDIVRTWAFYTMFRVWAITGEKPFEKLLVHGMILGTDGREMHKSLGNGVAPEELMKKYGVDAIRLWVALSGGIGKDKIFSYEELNYANAFTNKLWNSALFVRKSEAEAGTADEDLNGAMGIFDLWILGRLNQVTKVVEESYERLDLYGAMTALMGFYWHEFCDFYIENVKYRVNSDEKQMRKSRLAAVFTLKHVLSSALQLFSPVMPFIAEEINAMYGGVAGSIFNGKIPQYSENEEPSGYVINGVVFKSGLPETDYVQFGALLNNVIADVRKAKSGARLALNKQITAININVPGGYLNALENCKKELMAICKADKVSVKEAGEYSVAITV